MTGPWRSASIGATGRRVPARQALQFAPLEGLPCPQPPRNGAPHMASVDPPARKGPPPEACGVVPGREYRPCVPPIPAENGVIPTKKSDLIPAWMWHSRCRTQTQVSPKRVRQASRVSRGPAATALSALAVLSCGACELAEAVVDAVERADMGDLLALMAASPAVIVESRQAIQIPGCDDDIIVGHVPLDDALMASLRAAVTEAAVAEMADSP